ncbi:phage tail assembly protein [Pseudomonas nitroreducens]|uniref:phage tail assembly protein n=1 Tax=Pseudomonas nitroreducens TaxID=46680 RepID=UPI003D2821B8
MTEKKIPGWLSLSADVAVVKLSKPVTRNGVEVEDLTLRAPTVRDIRMASQLANNDEDRELYLFAEIIRIGRDELEDLKLSDYQRLQHAYFMLVREDSE